MFSLSGLLGGRLFFIQSNKNAEEHKVAIPLPPLRCLLKQWHNCHNLLKVFFFLVALPLIH